MGPEFSIFDKLPGMPMLWVRGPYWDVRNKVQGYGFETLAPYSNLSGSFPNYVLPTPPKTRRRDFHLIGMSTWASEFFKAPLPSLEGGQAVPYFPLSETGIKAPSSNYFKSSVLRT